MKKNNMVIVLVVVIALFVGYLAGGSKKIEADRNIPVGMHMMPNGTMMGDNTSNMNMEDMMSVMNNTLNGRTGDAFDKAFLAEMIIHHKGAVQMAQSALKNAKHQEIKDLAGNIISAQNKEIAEMENWQKAWFK